MVKFGAVHNFEKRLAKKAKKHVTNLMFNNLNVVLIFWFLSERLSVILPLKIINSSQDKNDWNVGLVSFFAISK